MLKLLLDNRLALFFVRLLREGLLGPDPFLFSPISPARGLQLLASRLGQLLVGADLDLVEAVTAE